MRSSRSILGGAGTLIGAIYGTVLLMVLKSVVGSWTEHHLIVIGLIFMVCVIFLPKGLIGFIRPRIEQRLSEQAATPLAASARTRSAKP